MTKRILIIEDDYDASLLLNGMLIKSGWPPGTVAVCQRLAEIENINPAGIEIVLTDLSLPDSLATETFEKVQERFPYTPIIVLTGTDEVDVATRTIQLGAQDYLIKGNFDGNVLSKAIHYAIERKKIANDYRRLFEENPAAMYIYDSKSLALLAINNAALYLYGYTKEDFPSLSADKIFRAEDLERLHSLNQFMPDSYADYGRWQHIKKNGDRFYVRMYAHNITFERRPAMFVLAIDVDKKVRTEQQLRDKNEEITNILESITDGFFAINKEWKFTYVNAVCETTLQKSRAELLGKNIWDEFPHGRSLKYYQYYNKAINNGVSVQFEEYDTAFDKWVMVNAYPSNDGLAVYFSDITEQKKLLEKVKKDEEHIRTIINNTNDIIWSVDKDCELIVANNSYKNRISALTNKHIGEASRADFRDEVVATWMGFYKRALAGEAFKTIWTENGSTHEIFEEVSFNPIRDENEIIGVSCFSRDVTAEKKYQRQIEQQNEQLRKIAWIQSHKVRSPVASILGLVQLFNENDLADPGNLEIIHNLKDAATRLDEVIHDINAHTVPYDG